MTSIRIGCGAGYSGDRIEPAVELAERGSLDYLVFECLAERTIALAQQSRAGDPNAGYDPLLLERMSAVLPACANRGVRVLTNMGAANPRGAARAIARLASTLGLHCRVAAVTGDDVLEVVRDGAYRLDETDLRVRELKDRLVSANAYLGMEPLVGALAAGADVVIAGRVADPSLFLAPMAYAFNWPSDDWARLGRGTLVGHLLECGGQVTGGYFADPGFKDVPHLARLGFPLAEVYEDGNAVITKVAGSGGRVTVATCTEQVLYEIHDPAAYVTPDVIADFSDVALGVSADDAVRVSGATGRSRPDTLKVSVGYRNGFVGEGQISYAGSGAAARARLALEIVDERLRLMGVELQHARLELIGVNAVHGASVTPASTIDPWEVRVRVAARTSSMRDAIRIGNEVEALYTNGPAGGGGVSKNARETLAVESILIPRNLVSPKVEWTAASSGVEP